MHLHCRKCSSNWHIYIVVMVCSLLVWFGYTLATSHSPTLIPFLQIILFATYPFVYAVFGVVSNFFFAFFLSIYLYYLLRWWCIMIVFKMVSIRWSANVRYHFRSYKTNYNNFSYIQYIYYIQELSTYRNYPIHLDDDISCSSVCLHTLNRSYSIKMSEAK